MRIKVTNKFADLIHAAIDRKYGDHADEEIRDVVGEALQLFRQAKSERSLLRTRVKTTDFRSDVINQTRCLYAIERYWRFRPPDRDFVRKVHSVACGCRLNDVKLRTEDYVADYGGIVPWQTRDIGGGLKAIIKELSQVCQRSTALAADQGLFLAGLFAMLIRVHPFEDGNGRTARMLVQYCLRAWDIDYIVVPKVRNDPQWKQCVDDGVQHNLTGLEEYFTQRLTPK
jgi:Fic family protein